MSLWEGNLRRRSVFLRGSWHGCVLNLGILQRGNLTVRKRVYWIQCSHYLNGFAECSESECWIPGDKINFNCFRASHFCVWNNHFRDWKEGKIKQKTHHRHVQIKLKNIWKIIILLAFWQLVKGRCWKWRLLFTSTMRPRTGVLLILYFLPSTRFLWPYCEDETESLFSSFLALLLI